MSTPGSSRLATGGAGEDAELRQLVSALPELYQPIHGHPEWSVGSSRACEDRWRTIADVYDRLAASYGRPLRVLDLGCA